MLISISGNHKQIHNLNHCGFKRTQKQSIVFDENTVIPSLGWNQRGSLTFSRGLEGLVPSQFVNNIHPIPSRVGVGTHGE